MKQIKLISITLIILLSACSNNTAIIDENNSNSSLTTPSTINPTSTSIPSTPTLIPTSTPVFINQICSPLANVELTDLSQIISQPFKLPPSGFDYDHQGVDFAFYRFKDQVGILGSPVNAILEGTVVAVMQNKYVYGNGLIIETPLEKIPKSWIDQMQPPVISPTVIPDSRLTCPKVENDPFSLLDINQRSLYVLYAHLNQIPLVEIGERVECGQQIGEVGNSGKSSNPHLHVETRIGPSGAIFNGLAHYDTHATVEEMHNYCTWRVSNLFQMFDPMRLLTISQ